MANLAELVEQLFQTHLRPDGRQFSNRDVSRALDGELEASYLGKIRSGKIDNPTRNTLLLLCRFFQVPPAYFFPELHQSVQEAAMEESEIREALALSAGELTPEARVHLTALIKVLKGKH